MKLQDLIIEYKKRTGLNNEAIAKKVGVSKSTVSRWVNGDISNLQAKTEKNLSLLLGIDVTTKIASNAFSCPKPIIGIVKAGYDYLIDEDIEDYLDVNEEDDKNGDFFLRVKGNSMELAHIFDGDLVYVKKCNTIESGKIGIVMIGDEVTLKKVIIKSDLLILEAANPNVETRYFTPKEIKELPIKIIGKVIYTRREF